MQAAAGNDSSTQLDERKETWTFDFFQLSLVIRLKIIGQINSKLIISYEAIQHRVLQNIPHWSLQKLHGTASKHMFVDLMVKTMFCLSRLFNAVISQLPLVQITISYMVLNFFETAGIQYRLFVCAK